MHAEAKREVTSATNGDRTVEVYVDLRSPFSYVAKDGIRELAAGFAACGLEVNTFEGHRFNRLAHLRWLIEQGLLDRELRWVGDSRRVGA